MNNRLKILFSIHRGLATCCWISILGFRLVTRKGLLQRIPRVNNYNFIVSSLLCVLIFL